MDIPEGIRILAFVIIFMGAGVLMNRHAYRDAAKGIRLLG